MIKFLKGLSLNNLNQKTCLLRIDLNVSSDEKESFRLDAVIPTLKHLQRYNTKIIILSHRGRPAGTGRTSLHFETGRPVLNSKLKTQNSKLSLKPFAKILSQKLKTKVIFVPSLKHLQQLKQLQPLTLLENIRFDPREEKNDRGFAKELASLGDIYINDAFSVSHRKNASVCAITEFLPSYAGLLFEKEITNLDHAMKQYQKPLTLILGGVKIDDKLGAIKYLKNKAAHILLGGDLVNYPTPKLKIICPPIDGPRKNGRLMDIGSKTIKTFTKIISRSKTIIWNGPMGKFENKKYATGTKTVWQAILKNKKAFSVIGGGETTSAIQKFFPKSLILSPNIFVSTGGGAMLEYLSGKKLPGIEKLNE